MLILGITVLGIGAIMLWGAPTLQAIQDRNSVIAMEGELIDVRTATLDLMIDKSSRLPEVVVQAGQFGFERGSNFLITSNQFENLGILNCEMVVTDWADSDDAFELDKSVCSNYPAAAVDLACPPVAGELCLDVELVTGGNTDSKSYTPTDSGTSWTITLDSDDFTDGDWVFTLKDNAENIAAQSWLLRTGRIAWELSSSSGSQAVYLEGGAVFEVRNAQSFLVKAPAIQEDASGNDDYFMRLPTYIGTSYSAVTSPVTAQVFVGQVGNNHVRISSDNTDSIRFQFNGGLSESWCRAMLARNPQLTVSSYSEPTTDACLDDSAAVIYERTDGTPFPFELSHARITTRIQL